MGEAKAQDYPLDWVTQQWVVATGRSVDLERDPWLDGPYGPPDGIGSSFFEQWARTHGLIVSPGATRAGLLPDFNVLRGPDFDPEQVDPRIARFYETAGDYSFDVWPQWRGAFRPFGGMLAALFSRRLQQLNMPLSALDTSRGVSSRVVQLREPGTGRVRETAWVREMVGSRNVLYAGSYSACTIPGHAGPCIKVVFPLPNGNAIVFLRPRAEAGGGFSLRSEGKRFGDPGFYFTVRRKNGGVRARYVGVMKERMDVQAETGRVIRADHVFLFGRFAFLQMHYRMTLNRTVDERMEGD
ncbi:MAG TPA: hypothetical protein VFJ16_12865 [Longimicrobium sp.]|nr:hypothetical protein [Longimicrobium sp.]